MFAHPCWKLWVKSQQPNHVSKWKIISMDNSDVMLKLQEHSYYAADKNIKVLIMCFGF